MVGLHESMGEDRGQTGTGVWEVWTGMEELGRYGRRASAGMSGAGGP